MASSGKPTQRICSLVSPNVGETLRLYAMEQEDAMRARLIAYRKQKEDEYEKQKATIMADFELRQWFVTHQAELEAWEAALTSVTEHMQERFMSEKDIRDMNSLSDNAVPQLRPPLMRKAFEEALQEARFKIEKDIVEKYEGRLEVVKHIRQVLAKSISHSESTLAVPIDPSVLSLLTGELDILHLKVNQLIDNMNGAKQQGSRELADHTTQEWNACIGQLRTYLESLLVAQHRTKTTALSSKASQRRRVLICIEKRIHDLRMFHQHQRTVELQESVSVYRLELLRLFAKYMHYMCMRSQSSGLKQLPPTARSLSGTNVLESIWASKKGITPEYKIKFMQSFLERVSDPILYESLLEVLQYYVV